MFLFCLFSLLFCSVFCDLFCSVLYMCSVLFCSVLCVLFFSFLFCSSFLLSYLYQFWFSNNFLLKFNSIIRSPTNSKLSPRRGNAFLSWSCLKIPRNIKKLWQWLIWTNHRMHYIPNLIPTPIPIEMIQDTCTYIPCN